MTLTVSHKGIAFIAQREACVTHAYQDGKHFSIGFGRNDPLLPAESRTTLEAAVLALDIEARQHAALVGRVLKVDVAQHEFDALVSANYQSGTSVLTDVVSRINNGARYEALVELLSDVLNQGAYDKGLARRRYLETRMFRFADYGPQPPIIRLYDGDPKVVEYTEIEFPFHLLPMAPA